LALVGAAVVTLAPEVSLAPVGAAVVTLAPEVALAPLGGAVVTVALLPRRFLPAKTWSRKELWAGTTMARMSHALKALIARLGAEKVVR
jgi:hypothetical protein